MTGVKSQWKRAKDIKIKSCIRKALLVPRRGKKSIGFANDYVNKINKHNRKVRQKLFSPLVYRLRKVISAGLHYSVL